MILLDAGGAILFVFPILLLFFMLVIVAIEAFVISKMLSITLKLGYAISFIANLLSLIAGLILMSYDLGFKKKELNFLMMFLITYVLEYTVFHLYFKSRSKKELLLTNLLMNVISYFILWLITYKML